MDEFVRAIKPVPVVEKLKRGRKPKLVHEMHVSNIDVSVQQTNQDSRIIENNDNKIEKGIDRLENISSDDKNQQQLITNIYTKNAIERYRAKNIDKIREYNKIHNQKKKEEKLKENPYYATPKTKLFQIIKDYEAKIKILEDKLKKYES